MLVIAIQQQMYARFPSLHGNDTGMKGLIVSQNCLVLCERLYAVDDRDRDKRFFFQTVRIIGMEVKVLTVMENEPCVSFWQCFSTFLLTWPR